MSCGWDSVAGACVAAPCRCNSEAAQQPTLTQRLQQKCSDWGTYWRASDAHGVVLTQEQALELLRDALGVEVELKEAAAGVSASHGETKPRED